MLRGARRCISGACRQKIFWPAMLNLNSPGGPLMNRGARGARLAAPSHGLYLLRSLSMKRNHNREKKEQRVIRVWEYEQARAALPYLASVMRSVRECRLEAVRLKLAARKLAGLPGWPDGG